MRGGGETKRPGVDTGAVLCTRDWQGKFLDSITWDIPSFLCSAQHSHLYCTLTVSSSPYWSWQVKNWCVQQRVQPAPDPEQVSCSCTFQLRTGILKAYLHRRRIGIRPQLSRRRIVTHFSGNSFAHFGTNANSGVDILVREWHCGSVSLEISLTLLFLSLSVSLSHFSPSLILSLSICRMSLPLMSVFHSVFLSLSLCLMGTKQFVLTF